MLAEYIAFSCACPCACVCLLCLSVRAKKLKNCLWEIDGTCYDMCYGEPYEVIKFTVIYATLTFDLDLWPWESLMVATRGVCSPLRHRSLFFCKMQIQSLQNSQKKSLSFLGLCFWSSLGVDFLKRTVGNDCHPGSLATGLILSNVYYDLDLVLAIHYTLPTSLA